MWDEQTTYTFSTFGDHRESTRSPFSLKDEYGKILGQYYSQKQKRLESFPELEVRRSADHKYVPLLSVSLDDAFTNPIKVPIYTRRGSLPERSQITTTGFVLPIIHGNAREVKEHSDREMRERDIHKTRGNIMKQERRKEDYRRASFPVYDRPFKPHSFLDDSEKIQKQNISQPTPNLTIPLLSDFISSLVKNSPLDLTSSFDFFYSHPLMKEFPSSLINHMDLYFHLMKDQKQVSFSVESNPTIISGKALQRDQNILLPPPMNNGTIWKYIMRFCNIWITNKQNGAWKYLRSLHLDYTEMDRNAESVEKAVPNVVLELQDMTKNKLESFLIIKFFLGSFFGKSIGTAIETIISKYLFPLPSECQVKKIIILGHNQNVLRLSFSGFNETTFALYLDEILWTETNKKKVLELLKSLPQDIKWNVEVKVDKKQEFITVECLFKTPNKSLKDFLANSTNLDSRNCASYFNWIHKSVTNFNQNSRLISKDRSTQSVRAILNVKLSILKDKLISVISGVEYL